MRRDHRARQRTSHADLTEELDRSSGEPGPSHADLTEELGRLVVEIGPMVGAQCGLNTPEDLCTPLFITLVSRLDTFDPRVKSMRNWVWMYARWIGIRESHRERSEFRHEGMTSDPAVVDLPSLIDEAFMDDSPPASEDLADRSVAEQIDSRRSYWQRKQEESWAAAREAVEHRELRTAKLNAYRCAVYEMLLDTPTDKLTIPWLVLFLGTERELVASQLGASRNKVDQDLCRFRKRIRSRSEELLGSLAI